MSSTNIGRGSNYRGRGWWSYGRGKNYRGGNRASSTAGSSHGASNSKSSSQAPSRQRIITVLLNDTRGPYKGWKLYRHSEEYSENSDTVKKVKLLEEYITKNKSSFNLEKIDEKNSVQIDLNHLQSDSSFKSGWPNFINDLNDKPNYVLNCMGLAIHKVFNLDEKTQVRPMNHQPVLPLTSLKVNYFGKLVTIRGTVIRVGSPSLICTSMAFECTSCHGVQALVQPQGVFTVPTVCFSCQSIGKFEPLQSSPFTITSDCQTARIQETQAQGVTGSIPRSIEVELQGDLVGSACPGDLLSVTGIVQVRGEVRGGEDGKKAARLMQIYVEAVAVHSQRTLNHPTLTFTLKDYYAIQEIHAAKDVFRLIVQSLCPSIFGQEMVKAGLILGLMGGTEAEGGSRTNPHILVVGDPGLGKSQLLQAATLAAPRGVYVCGNACTASGLTVSLTRSEGGGFTLEAGALVLADRGVCCADELDKLGAGGHGALLEAMEQGSVSVARGGVVCRLAAAPTILAAANPMHGHYDRSKTVSENLHMSSALLSRFDLVFILLDKPNEHMDALLSEHVLALHAGEKPKAFGNVSSVVYSGSSQNQDTRIPLSERLKMQQGEIFDPLPLELLRKYIAYAKKYVHPKLSKEAALVLKEYFLKMRKYHQSIAGNTPVTTRQLEACIRLTQARARVELREEATVDDAKDIIELMNYSLQDTLNDEFGDIQITRSVHGSGMSSQGEVKKFIGIITKRAEILGKNVFTSEELGQIHKASNIRGRSEELISNLNIHGYLLKKGPKLYKLNTL